MATAVTILQPLVLEKKHIRSCCTQTSASDLVPEADECVAGIKVDVLLFAGYAEMLINRVLPCFSWQLCWWSFNLCTEGAPGTARQYKAESFLQRFVCVCPVKPTAEWGKAKGAKSVRGYDVLHRQYRNYAAQVVVQFDYQQAKFSARKKDLHWTAGFKRDSSWIWKRNQMNPSWMSLQCFHVMSGKWIPDWRKSHVWETSGSLDRNTVNMTAETLGANSWLAGDLVQRLH